MCLEEFFSGLISRKTIKSLILEIEEYVANSIVLKFELECEKRLARGLSVVIVYTPGEVKRLVVDLLLSSEISAKDFITRIYQSLLSRRYNVELSREFIRVTKELSCRDVRSFTLVRVLNEALGEFGEACSARYSGTYEMLWGSDSH